MRRISALKLKPGMELGKTIYANSGVVLLREGTILTQNYVEKIQLLDLPYIYIKDCISQGIEIEDVISEETRYATMKTLSESIEQMKKGYVDINANLSEAVTTIIDEVVYSPSVILSIQEMRNKNVYLLGHSVNVCVLSLFLAKKRSYNRIQLRHLALGALLHDIGKIKLNIPIHLLHEEDTPEQTWELYKKHTREGYDLIKVIPNSSLLAANVALTHHERFDGSGFPYGKCGSEIHEFSRIVAIADMYDNLLYGSTIKLRHYEIVEWMVSKAYTYFDPELIRVFRMSVSLYPVGMGVRLSNGQIGIVSKLNENLPTRPFVRILDPKELSSVVEEIDMSKNLNVMIVDEVDLEDFF